MAFLLSMTCPLSVTLAVTTLARIAASACGSRLNASAMQQAMASRTRRKVLLMVDITYSFPFCDG